MNNWKKVALCALLGAALIPAVRVSATVSLRFSDVTVPDNFVAVLPGDTFTVLLELISTAEQTTGLDYSMRVNTQGSGLFRITDRNIGASLYNDPNRTDAQVEAPAAGLLDPEPGTPNTDPPLPLGAGVLTLEPVGAGTHRVANYTFIVSASAPMGTYTISTFSQPGTGYVGPPPNFDEAPFNSHASYTVFVIPEPGIAALIGVGLLALSRRGRRR